MPLDILEKATVQYSPHVFPWHVHPDYHCLSLVTGGSAVLEVPHRRLRVQAGELVFIPAGLPHRTIVEQSFSYQVIRFQDQGGHENPAFQHLSATRWGRDFASWFAASSTTTSDDKFLAFFLEGGEHKRKQDATIVHCLDYMHQHYTQRLSIEDLSRVALRSSSHLRRTFRQQMGISPIRYLLGLKVDKAKVLLQQGHTLIDTALNVGFYDQSHFTRHFKQLSGLSPKAYQRLLLE